MPTLMTRDAFDFAHFPITGMLLFTIPALYFRGLQGLQDTSGFSKIILHNCVLQSLLSGKVVGNRRPRDFRGLQGTSGDFRGLQRTSQTPGDFRGLQGLQWTSADFRRLQAEVPHAAPP